ncbi:Vps54-like protein-domain-containing protein [Chytriomyces sp. MP71]|nr:Vps54-like protein-domain-containing protein [Chytriomyces sp. MP71]
MASQVNTMQPGAESTAADRYEALVNNEHVWTQRDIGTNAIQAIITDPKSKSVSQLKGMDALPLPPPTLIRRVKAAEFDAYHQSIAAVLDRFSINQTLGAAAIEGAPMLKDLNDQVMDDLTGGSFADLVAATERIIPDTLPAKRIHTDRATHRRLIAAHAPPLDTVPEIFFDANFKLGNPATFASVYEKADFSKLSLNDVNLTSALLQDKLGVFCDTVDVYLVKEISKRSASFFNALSTLQALHLETQSCIAQIHTLRARLEAVTSSTIHPGLNVARLHTRRANMQKLHDGIEVLYKVQSSFMAIDVFVAGKQFVDAIDVIEEGKAMLEGLVGVQALQGGTSLFVAVDDTASIVSGGVGGVVEAVVNIVPASVAPTITPSPQLGTTAAGNSSSNLLDPSSAEHPTEEPNLMRHLYAELTKKQISIAEQMETEFMDLLLAEVRELADQVENAIGRDSVATPILGTPAAKWIKNIQRRKRGEDIVPVTESRANSGETLVDDVLMSRLLPLVFGLLRIDRFSFALQKYKEMVMKEIKALSKKNYPVPPAEVANSPQSPSSPTKKEMQSILAKQLKQMSFDSFCDLLVNIYTLLLHIFQKSSSIHAIISTVIHKAEEQGIHVGKSLDAHTTADTIARNLRGGSSNTGRSLTPIPDDDDDFGSGMDLIAIDPMAQELELAEKHQEAADATAFSAMISESSELLLNISEAATARCAKLLTVRSDQNSKLSPKDFYRLLWATKDFIAASEFLCGYHCINLYGALLSQAKSFMNHFHDERTKQIAIVVENEQWSRAEVPIDFQRMSEEISSRGTDAAADKKKTATRTSIDDDDEGDLAALVMAQKEAAVAASEDELVTSGKALKVDGSTYCVAGCVLLLTKMLTEYLQAGENMPGLATEVLNKILDLLKVFNSRICQVILGAGATKSAGLKNINAGHIALTAQSLGAVVGYIPHIKAALERRVPAKQQALLGDFDRILKDYKEHQTALYDKLVNIMQERLAFHAKNLLNVNWDAPEAKDMTADQVCTVHIAGLVKETSTMHRVLMKFLPKPVLQMVMSQIFKSYNKGLEEDLKKVELYTSAGKNRLLMDGQHLMAELSALENIDGPGNSIEVAINNIKIRDKRTQNTSTTDKTVSIDDSKPPSKSSTATAAAPPTPSTTQKGKNLFSKWKD